MANLSMHIRGLEELQQKFSRAPDAVSDEMKAAMERSVIDVQGEVRRLTPVDTGRLRASIATDVRGTLGTMRGVIGSAVHYAPYVEFGARPHWPPLDAMQPWARRHGFGPGREGAFLVARAISRKGTKAREMFQKGLEAARDRVERYFADAAKRIAEKLG